MRHRRATKRLARSTSNRKALLRSLVRNLFINERILTSYAKAKEASALADRLVSLGKRKTNTAKKNAISILGSKALINKLFDDIAPRFAARQGGYTRTLQLATRKGDGAKIAILELTERKVEEKPQTKKAAKIEAAAKRAPSKEEKIEEEPTPKEEKGAALPPEKAPISTKEKLDEEKGKERAKSEKDKLRKGFFKDLRRYFRRKSF